MINRRWTWAIATAALFVARAALAQEDTAAPVISPLIFSYSPTMDQTSAHGKALLTQAKWTTLVDDNTFQLRVVGPMLLVYGRRIMNSAMGQGSLLLLDRDTGRVLWQRPTEETDPALEDPASPINLTQEGIEYFDAQEGQLRFMRLSPENGQKTLVWEKTYGARENALERPANGQPLMKRATPAISDQRVIAGEKAVSFQPPKSLITIRSFDRKTGEPQWSTPAPVEAFSASVQVADGRAYVTVVTVSTQAGTKVDSPRAFLLTLDAASGKTLWKTEETLASAPLVQGPMLVALSVDGDVVAYDAQTGKEKWRTALSMDCDPAKSKFGPLRSMGNVYAANGRLLATFDKRALPQGIPAIDKAEGGIAVLDPRNGKQTGYFNGGGILQTTDDKWQSSPVFPALATFKDQIVLGDGPNNFCTGINGTTLRLEWQISGRWAVSDGMLYVHQNRQGKGEILAIPLDVR